MAKARAKKLNTLFSAFGIGKNKAEKLQKKYNKAGLKAQQIYTKLKKETGKKPGGSFMNWATSGGRSGIFKKQEAKYERKFGQPGLDRLAELQRLGQEEAAQYYAPEAARYAGSLEENRKRLEENYQANVDALNRQFGYTQEDIARNRQQTDRDYQQRLADLQLATQQENEGLTADINAAGQFDSSLYGKRFGRLAQQQGARLGGVTNAYNDYIGGLNTQLQRAQEGYNTGLSQYQRNRSRDLYDIDQMEQQKKLDLERAQQGYAADYLGSELGDIQQGSQNYYDRQNENDTQAAQYLQDLNQVID